jgi:hypothetical protein
VLLHHSAHAGIVHAWMMQYLAILAVERRISKGGWAGAHGQLHSWFFGHYCLKYSQDFSVVEIMGSLMAQHSHFRDRSLKVT